MIVSEDGEGHTKEIYTPVTQSADSGKELLFVLDNCMDLKATRWAVSMLLL